MAEFIPTKIRTIVAKRAGYFCEYCRTPAAFSSSKFSVEHIIPRINGGSSTLDNLAYACQGCNNIKFTKTKGIDPELNILAPFFHPRNHNWAEHFCWDASLLEIIGLTPTGRATIEALKLNRSEVCIQFLITPNLILISVTLIVEYIFTINYIINQLI